MCNTLFFHDEIIINHILNSIYYIFTSNRLGFRNWLDEDLQPFAKLNADPEVMQYFPNTLSLTETENFIIRAKKQYEEKGFTYFAVEELKTQKFIGFIGLSYQIYKAPFTPCVDIGWRLAKEFWGNGYATEGAERCLKFAFENLKLKQIIAVCTVNNTASENVMKKIRMNKQGYFRHPSLHNFPKLQKCVYYKITN